MDRSEKLRKNNMLRRSKSIEKLFVQSIINLLKIINKIFTKA